MFFSRAESLLDPFVPCLPVLRGHLRFFLVPTVVDGTAVLRVVIARPVN